ncbi:MAG: CubicO group peptidase (beta-lactamase class C family) [Porticoccaceae bacterium]|jgi:CubicO group peptidase (beta-lactamase class C family)
MANCFVSTVRVLIVLLLVAASSHVSQAAEIPTAAPEDVGMSSTKLAKVDDVLDRLVEQKRLAGGTVVIARRGKIVHFKSYGMADIESKRPMKNDAIMRFYSMSKAITSAAVMILADEGKLDVNDAVSKHIPELQDVKVATSDGLVAPKREVTIADLLRHTAGYTYGGSSQPAADAAFKKVDPLDHERTLKQMGERLADVPLAFQPGEDWIYGISIDVLGRVIEVASGQPLDKFLKKRIFKPLGMRDTGFFVPKKKHDRFAPVYNSDEQGKLTVGDNEAHRDFSKPRAFLSGGGGLVSTARDYLRFLMMIQQGGTLDGKRIVSEKSVQLMTTSQLPKEVPHIYFGDQQRVGVGFGFGFSVREKMSDWDPTGRVGEYGWGGMASTHYWVSPKDELIVITLEQTLPYSFMTEFAVKSLIYDALED